MISTFTSVLAVTCAGWHMCRLVKHVLADTCARHMCRLEQVLAGTCVGWYNMCRLAHVQTHVLAGTRANTCVKVEITCEYLHYINRTWSS